MFVQNFDENHDEDFTKIGTITCANLQQLTRSAFDVKSPRNTRFSGVLISFIKL